MSITINDGPVTFYRGEDPLKADKLNLAFSERVLRTGDTMIGKLVLAMDPQNALDAVTKQYVDANFLLSLNAAYLQLAGGTMQGFILLHADPTQAMHAATRQYVDAKAAAVGSGIYLPLVGGTLTGPLNLSADPTVPLQAATKSYVDTKVATVTWTTITGKPATFPPTLPIAQSGVTNLVADLAAKEATIVAGTTAQYWRGDKTWVAFPAIPVASSTLPIIEGTAAVGTSLTYARADHVHPSTAGGAFLTDAPSDGKAYSRRNAVWTSNPWYDARGNIGVSVTPPTAAASSASNANGGWMFMWGITANNWSTNGYYDGSAWRYLSAGTVWQQQMTDTFVIWQYAPSGAKDAVATVTNKMVLDSVGNLSLAGNVVANGGAVQIKTAQDARLNLHTTGAPADAKIVDMYVGPTGAFGMQFVNDAFTDGRAFFQAARTGYAVSSVSLTAPSVNLNGYTTVSGELVGTGNIFAGGAVFPANVTFGNGFALYGDGSGNRQIRFTTDNWRMYWQTDGSLVYASPNTVLWYVTPSGGTWQVGNPSVAGGVIYRGFSVNAMGFGWDGTNGFINTYVDGTHQGAMAIQGRNVSFNNIVSQTGRILAQNTSNNPSIASHNPGSSSCMAWWVAGAGAWQWGWADAAGTPGGVFGYLSNTTIGFAVGSISIACNNGAYSLCWGDGGQFIVPGIAYKPGGGAWADGSDARIKDVLGEYETGLEAILALRPIRYRFRGNWNREGAPQAAHREVTEKEFIGLVAQEAEMHMPEMVTRITAKLDDREVDDLRVLDMTALPLALVNAIQQLTDRIVALEARA